VNWQLTGYMAVDNRVFDVGITIANALASISRGAAARYAGGTDEYDNGNGSLMRVLPLALWHTGTDAELVRDAQLQSRVTHAHLRSQLCCALYCLWARRQLQNVADPWNEAASTLREIYPVGSLERIELDTHIQPDQLLLPRGSGYVVDCLHSARWAVGQGEYEQVVKAAISLGNDTDTTACVAGGIAGIRDGIEAVPLRWRQALRGRDLLDPLLNQLLDTVLSADQQ
jgi:ADP-ribosylglycohydrolase